MRVHHLKKFQYIHPVLFVIFPILSLYTQNIDQLFVIDTIRISIISILGVVTILIFVAYLIRSWEIAAALISGMAILFFSYGHVYLFIKNLMLGSLIIGRHRYLIVLWVILFIAWIWLILAERINTHSLTTFLFITSVAANVLASTSLVRNLDLHILLDPKKSDYLETSAEFNPLTEYDSKPDIYYIIVDGYGREDILFDLYNFDNSRFINFLRDEGFYVADMSRSNYNQTDLSLASSLNMTYLDQIPESYGKEFSNLTPLVDLISNNEVAKLLRGSGYEIVAFNSGYRRINLYSADIFWDSTSGEFGIPMENPVGLDLNSLEVLVLRSSALILLFDPPQFAQDLKYFQLEDPQFSAHRSRILYNLHKIRDIPLMDGDYFVYAHIIAPHPPFVFGPRGQWIKPQGTYTLAVEGTLFPGSPDDYIEGYVGQIEYLNDVLTETIEDILKKSDPRPVIILQGDHGPGAYLDQHSNENSNYKERISILNAYFFPTKEPSLLYPSISPVNSFRVVFNQIFRAGFDLLEDRSYFSTIDEPYNFLLVPDNIDS